MHPYGGTPICPRCTRAVYAAEQIMGPGRKLYHKPCLACTSCNKRLDSLSLLEHNQEPYCKSCHTKLFGTRDLRQANLPHREEFAPVSPPKDRATTQTTLEATYGSRSRSPPIQQGNASGNNGIDETVADLRTVESPPVLRPNRTLSPTAECFPAGINKPSMPEWDPDETADTRVDSSPNDDGGKNGQGAAYTGDRSKGAIPRTIPLNPIYTGRTYSSPNTKLPSSFSTPISPTKPLTATSTGGRWAMHGTGTPMCPKCGKAVYFAEQVKASGKTFHKLCLRCTECNTALDSSRLTEKDGQVLCRNCYGKLHGPQGSGYALVGKAGG
ncbi:LIM-domain-containing protein [Rickenella mellea]|uniref:LIM-domain-containing protein n=1 Tax=Rickenella mellea TaxID=50990 RepID=A0A4Y7QGN1_9AGAM|nr:LIM-domain-containing protein [Rickenella mellea]